MSSKTNKKQSFNKKKQNEDMTDKAYNRKKIIRLVLLAVIFYVLMISYAVPRGYIRNYPISRETTPIFVFAALLGLVQYRIGKYISDDKKILKNIILYSGLLNLVVELILIAISLCR